MWSWTYGINTVTAPTFLSIAILIKLVLYAIQTKVCAHLTIITICGFFHQTELSRIITCWSISISLHFSQEAQTSSSMTMCLGIKWAPWRQGSSRLEWKNSSGLPRALASTPVNIFGMNSPDISAWSHYCSCGWMSTNRHSPKSIKPSQKSTAY